MNGDRCRRCQMLHSFGGMRWRRREAALRELIAKWRQPSTKWTFMFRLSPTDSVRLALATELETLLNMSASDEANRIISAISR